MTDYKPFYNPQTGEYLTYLEHLRQIPTGPYSAAELRDILGSAQHCYDEYSGPSAEPDISSASWAAAYQSMKLLRLHKTLVKNG